MGFKEIAAFSELTQHHFTVNWVDLIHGKKQKSTWYKRTDFQQGMEAMNKHADVVILRDGRL